jgi:hypothetical protein
MSDKRLRITQAALFVVAIAFIALGVARGEQLEVLQKAAAVCLECIGLG